MRTDAPTYDRHRMTAPEPGAPLERLQAHALEAVAAVVPVSLAWCFEIDRRHRPGRTVVLQPGRPDLDAGAEWCRSQVDDDPFAAARVEARGATVLALKDFDDDESGPLRRRLADAGLADRADVYLRSAGRIVAQFALVRSSELGSFSRDDLNALRRLQPLLEHAFACALEPRTPDAHAALVGSGLSAREADVAEMAGRGATNAAIARSLHIGEATVKTHLTQVYTKLGVRTRTQLALLLGRTTSG
jgi:DNA-binding NarL/FixJ family response regulator